MKNRSDLSTDELWNLIKDKGPANRTYNRLPDLGEYERRREFVTELAWAVPTEGVIKAIKDFVKGDHVIEVGAGIMS
jgi:hypothetical protein